MGLTDALIAALAADSPAVPAAVADRPKNMGTGPGIVIWPMSPMRAGHTLADPNGAQTLTLLCHCVGLTPQSAQIAEQKLAAAVYGLYQTVVDGRLVLYPQQVAAPPMIRDDDVSPPLYDLAVEWRLRTIPTS